MSVSARVVEPVSSRKFGQKCAVNGRERLLLLRLTPVIIRVVAGEERVVGDDETWDWRGASAKKGTLSDDNNSWVTRLNQIDRSVGERRHLEFRKEGHKSAQSRPGISSIDDYSAVGSTPVMIQTEIVNAVKDGKCILFLGAMASAPSPEGCKYVYEKSKAPPGGAELSRRLARLFSFDSGDDSTNIQRVSLFAEFYERADAKGSRKALIDAVAREIARPTDETPDDFQIEPSPALSMLAAMPFRITITTNYDHLFERALRDARSRDGRRKDPLVRVYDPTGTSPPEEVPVDPEEHKPVLLKLHGDIDKPETIVITEEDYIRFVQRMASTHHPVHDFIRMRMRAWPFLFIGYSLRDYNLRLLFRTLKSDIDVAYLPLSYAVDPYPDNLVVAVSQRAGRREVEFIREDLWTFVPELYKAVFGKDFQP